MSKRNAYFFYTDGGARPNPGAAGYGVHGCYYSPDAPKKGLGLNGVQATPLGYITKPSLDERTAAAFGKDKGGRVIIDQDALAKVDPEWRTSFGEEACADASVNPWYTADISDTAYFVKINPIEYIDMDFSFGLLDKTNNYGELRASIAAMSFALDHMDKRECGLVYILTDSEHVVDCSGYIGGWKQRNWCNSRGVPIKNLEDWQEFDRIKTALEEKNVLVILKHVSAHVGEHGNEIADRLATGSVIRSVEMRVGDPDRASVGGQTDITPADGYWKTDVETNPFMTFPTLFFNTFEKYNRPGVYALGRRTKDFHHQGKRDAQDAYAVVRLAKPIDIIEDVITRQAEIGGDGDELYAMHLGRLNTPYVYRDWERWGKLAFFRGRAWLNDLIELDDKIDSPITRHFKDVGLAYRTGEALDVMESILNASLIAHNGQEIDQNAFTSVPTLTDITSTFYEAKMVKKGKAEVEVLELHPRFKPGHTDEKVTVGYDLGDVKGEKEVILTFAIDIPDRNALRRLQELKPKVYVATWPGSDFSFRHATIIVGENGECGIWCGYYSNICFVKPQS